MKDILYIIRHLFSKECPKQVKQYILGLTLSIFSLILSLVVLYNTFETSTQLTNLKK